MVNQAILSGAKSGTSADGSSANENTSMSAEVKEQVCSLLGQLSEPLSAESASVRDSIKEPSKG
jgi:hypothetical protein